MTTDTHRFTTAISKGDESAFREFYDAYSPRMRRYLYAMARGDSHLADDVFQDSMLRMIRYVRPFESGDILWLWLVRLMKTAFIDQIRRRNSARLSSFPVEVISDEMNIPDVAEEEYLDSLLKHLDKALETLEPDDRTLLESHYFEGIQQNQLAKARNTTPKAIGMKFSRIRGRLKSFLERSLQNE